MRFTGARELPMPAGQVWEALHDAGSLREAVPGCESLVPLGPGVFEATLAVRVGPVADTYRGTFTVEDLRPGTDLRVRIEGRGRVGRLEVDLRVSLTERHDGSTVLRYDATAGVRGLVARLGTPTLTVAGGHLTATFFRGLDRSLRRRTPVPALV